MVVSAHPLRSSKVCLICIAKNGSSNLLGIQQVMLICAVKSGVQCIQWLFVGFPLAQPAMEN